MRKTTLHPLILDPSYQLALTAAMAADERKGGDIVLLGVSHLSSLADYFLIVSGYSTTQVRALARGIEENVLEKYQQLPRRMEGQNSSTWILMDYADVIVHIMLPEERSFYDLETFWGQAERINLALVG